MVAIRSWSGGFLSEILSSNSSCDECCEISHPDHSDSDIIQSDVDDNEISSYDSYDDDFTDDESEYSEPNGIEGPCMDSIESSSNDHGSSRKCGSPGDIDTKLQISSNANTEYKKWLRSLQEAARKKEQSENIVRERTKEREKLKRDKLVRRALRRRRVRFDFETTASENGRFETKKDYSNNASDVTSSSNRIDWKQRQKNIREHKKFLHEIVKQRERNNLLQLQAQEETDRKRRNVTRLIMNEIRKRNSVPVESEKIDEFHLPHNLNPECIVKAGGLKQRCIEEFKRITESRRKRREEKRKKKLRLDKRARILREKYITKLKREKPWERDGSKNHFHQQELDERKDMNEDGKAIILTPTKVKALAERLTKKSHSQDVDHTRCNGYTFDKWKNDHQVLPWQKVFSMTGWYPSIKEDLLDRGWVYNEDRDSQYFDLKFTLAASDIDFNSLKANQVVNHFRTSTCLTTKVGLMHTLSNSTHSAIYNKDVLDYFPRSYDFSHPPDVQAFFDDYHCIQAESTLKQILKKWYERESFQVNVGVLKTLSTVIRRHFFVSGEQFIELGGSLDEQCFTELQSMIVRYSHEWIFRKIKEEDLIAECCPVIKLKNLLVDKGKQVKENRMKPKQLNRLIDYYSHLEPISKERISFIEATLKKYCGMSVHQNTINGNQSNNLWILKPAGKSRGRGISVESSLNGILNHIEATSDSRNRLNQWVIQKYIENPLIIAKRKFDIRQWILVTSWNPITIWYYNDCYIRFAVDEYDVPQNFMNTNDKNEWSANKFRHLVNNSIGKKNKNFSNEFLAEETNETIRGCMWSLETFRTWLQQKTDRDEWTVNISPAIKEIVIDSLLCSQEKMMSVESKGCWEVYGFDIMIDQNLRPWLIEVNSSPACDYSTEVTEKFVRKALPDTLKVILDGNSNPNLQSVHRGGWQCIYCGMIIPKVIVGLGVDLTLKGSKISNKRSRNKGKHRTKKQVIDLDKDPLFDDSDLSEYEKSSKGKVSMEAEKTEKTTKDYNKENERGNGKRSEVYQSAKVPLKKYCLNRKTKNVHLKTMVTLPLNKVTIDF